MNLLDRFESYVERLMERGFTRAARSRLQPVEIGKRLVRAMESEQRVGMEGSMVPNVYDVYLSPADFSQFGPVQESLSRNMETHLARVARQRRFQLVSRPVVRLHEDRGMRAGDVLVEPHLQDVREEAPVNAQATGVLPQVDALGDTVTRRPNLILNNQVFGIQRSPTTVGRLPDNDIVLSDKRVSRHHAEIAEQGRRWVLRDVGSTNGTAVNGKMVKEAALSPGDAISLGGLEARWEQ